MQRLILPILTMVGSTALACDGEEVLIRWGGKTYTYSVTMDDGVLQKIGDNLVHFEESSGGPYPVVAVATDVNAKVIATGQVVMCSQSHGYVIWPTTTTLEVAELSAIACPK